MKCSFWEKELNRRKRLSEMVYGTGQWITSGFGTKGRLVIVFTRRNRIGYITIAATFSTFGTSTFST